MKIALLIDDRQYAILEEAFRLNPEDEVLLHQGKVDRVSDYAKRIVRARMALEFHPRFYSPDISPT